MQNVAGVTNVLLRKHHDQFIIEMVERWVT